VPSLEHLTLRWCDDLTDAGVAGLQLLQRLTHLKLEYCSQVRAALGLAAHLPALTSLRVASAGTPCWTVGWRLTLNETTT